MAECPERNEMKPVPCGCGGEAHHDSASCWNPEEEEWMPNFWHRVICKNCGTQTKAFYTEAEAVTAWNRAMGTDVRTLMKVFAYDATCAVCEKKKERMSKVKTVEKPNVFKCSECGQYFHRTAWGSPVEYCSRCGAKLDWSGNE